MRRPVLQNAVPAAFLAAVLTACETPPPPPPPPPPQRSIALLYEQPAERALITGIRLYDEGTFDRAEASFRAALGDGLKDPHDLAVAHKYLAFIACAFNRLAECEQGFRDAIAADHGFRLTEAEIGHPIWGPVYRRVLATAPAPAPKAAGDNHAH
jgi:hypothetical protein